MRQCVRNDNTDKENFLTVDHLLIIFNLHILILFKIISSINCKYVMSCLIIFLQYFSGLHLSLCISVIAKLSYLPIEAFMYYLFTCPNHLSSPPFILSITGSLHLVLNIFVLILSLLIYSHIYLNIIIELFLLFMNFNM